MNPRVQCDGIRHLVIEDVPGPNDTVDRTVVVDARACDCPPPEDDTT